MTFNDVVTLLGGAAVVGGATWVHPGLGVMMFGVFLISVTTQMKRQKALAAFTADRDAPTKETQH